MARTPKTRIRSFGEAKDFFESKIVRSRTYVGSVRVARLEHNTVIRKTYDRDHGEGYAIRLHDTDIVTYYADGALWIEADGWASVTTAERMHRHTPDHVRVNYRWNEGWHRLIVTTPTEQTTLSRGDRSAYVLTTA